MGKGGGEWCGVCVYMSVCVLKTKLQTNNLQKNRKKETFLNNSNGTVLR